MICSHSHGTYEPSLPTTLDKGKILDVGWDVFKIPVSYDQIHEIMKLKNTFNPDHHNKETT